MRQSSSTDDFNAHYRSVDEERMKILGWLSSVAYHEKYTDTLRRRHENTGKWFLELAEFQDWLKNESKNVLWCKGDPGVGKTILAYVFGLFQERFLKADLPKLCRDRSHHEYQKGCRRSLLLL